MLRNAVYYGCTRTHIHLHGESERAIPFRLVNLALCLAFSVRRLLHELGLGGLAAGAGA